MSDPDRHERSAHATDEWLPPAECCRHCTPEGPPEPAVTLPALVQAALPDGSEIVGGTLVVLPKRTLPQRKHEYIENGRFTIRLFEQSALATVWEWSSKAGVHPRQVGQFTWIEGR